MYDTCKLQYKLKYIDYLPDDYNGITNTDALQYGSYIHKIFEDGVEAKEVDELFTLATTLRKNYHFGPEKDKATEGNLKNFFHLNERLASKTVHIAAEQSFAIEIKDGFAINGIIDRIVKNKAGEYLVIDYKTSKRSMTKTEMYNDPQMVMYAFAISKMYNVPTSKVRVAHYYPHKDLLVDIKYTTAHVNNFMRKLVEKIWEIRKRKKSEFFPEVNQYCKWCGYYDICPRGQGTERILRETLDSDETKLRIKEKRDKAKAYNKQFKV